MATLPRANAKALAAVKHAADENHRAENVDEECEVPVVRSDRGETLLMRPASRSCRR